MLLSLFVSSEPLRLSHSLSTRCRHWFFFSFSFHFVCAEMPWMPRMPNAEYRAWRCTDASAGYRHFTFCAFFSHFLFRLLCAWACVWVCGEYYFSTSLKSRSFSSVHHGYTEHFVVNSIGLFSFLLLFSPIVFQFHIILYNFIYIHTRTWLIIYMNCSREEKKTRPKKGENRSKRKKKQRREWAQWKPYKNRCLSRWNNKFQYNVYIILIFCVVCYFLLVLSHSHFVNKHIRIQLTAREQATKKECRNQKIAFTKKKKKWRKFFGLCVCAHTHTHTRWYANFMSLVNKKPLWAIHCITIAIFRRWFYSLW